MKTWPALLLVAASVSFAPLAASAEDKVLARVNGVEIKESDLNFARSEVGPRISALKPDDRRQVLLQFIIENELMATAAENDKLDKAATFETRAAYHRRRALRDAFYDVGIAGEVKEADAKKIFDAKIAEMKPQQEVRARHILVDSEADAKKVKERLEAGEDFAAVADELSNDKNAKGGDLGFFTRGQMLKPFEDSAFSLEIGKLSDPVKTQFGWHIIKVEEKRDQELPKFDDVKDAIAAQLLAQKAQSVVAGLRADAKIEILDPDLKRAMDDAAIRGEAPPLPEEEFNEDH